VARLGFDADGLVHSLRSREQNKATVTYYLLSDNRRRTPSSGYLSGEMQEGPGGAAGAGAFGFGAAGQAAAAAHAAAHAAAAAAAAQQQHGGGLPQQRVVAERRWRLGVAARGHPSALMAELYRVLQVGRGAAAAVASAGLELV
jgi:5'-AMP-activated protein kinase catalytic alpha subunit